MKNNFLYIGLAFVLIVMLFLNWIRQENVHNYIQNKALSKLASVEKITHPQKMPAIEVAGPEGSLITLPDDKNYMLINVWSIKCRTCLYSLESLKQLQQLMDNYDEKWQIIAVSIDAPKDLEKVAKVIKQYRLTEVAGYYDAKRELQNFIDSKTLPTTILVDKKGHILYKIYGKAPWLDPDIVAFLRTLPRSKDK